MPYGNISWRGKADGWLPVEDKTLVASIQNTQRTPWEISVFTNGMIAPKWVFEAVESYHKVGGFAGMSLTEWLDKVSDGRKEEPKHTF